MTLPHFRRTFVEKLFAIHGKVERLKQEDKPLGRDVRRQSRRVLEWVCPTYPLAHKEDSICPRSRPSTIRAA